MTGMSTRASSGQVFTVRVAGPGRTAYGVVVRAETADQARGRIEARGHRVIGVREGQERSVALDQLPPLACFTCGYELARLPVGPKKQVQCPECGSVNMPISGRVQDAHRRLGRIRVFSRIVTLVVVVMFVSLLAIVGWSRVSAIFAAAGGGGAAVAPVPAPTPAPSIPRGP
jgi:hypothetical protein